MTASIWQTEPSLFPAKAFSSYEHFDCVIIGAGIAGASVAYALSDLCPKWRVAVIEKHRAAAGASGRNAGFLIAGTADHYGVAVEKYGRAVARDVFAVTVATQRRVKEFLAKHPEIDCDYVPSGSVTLAGTEDESRVLEASATLLREDGFDVEYVATDPLNRKFHGAILNRHDGGIHPAKLTRGLFLASGAAVFEGVECLALDAVNGHVEVETNCGALRAERVMVTVNAAAPLVADHFRGKIFPKRGQCLSTAPFPRRLLEPVVYANDGFEYFRQLPDGRFLFGGGRRAFQETEVGYDDVTTEGVQNFLERFMATHFPELQGIEIERRWSGVMGFTADGMPSLGALPDVPGVWFSLACIGHGMGFSLEVGAMAAEMMTGKPPLQWFDARRLSQ
jgi:glycine/D-amino acid oxidase-like deaminating enzyme